MTAKVRLPNLIGNWSQEAFAAYGDDWQRISSYIRTKVDELSATQRNELDAEAEMTLKTARGDTTTH